MLKKYIPIIAILILASFLSANETALRLVGKIDMGPVTAISANGNVVYAGITSNLNIYDIYNEAVPQLINCIEGHSSIIKEIKTFQDRLYVVYENEGLFIFDISRPFSPVEIGSFTEKSIYIQSYSAMALNGDLVYLAGKSYFAILNMSNPATPIMLKLQPIPDSPLDIDYEAGKLWLATGVHGLAVFDVNDPADTRFLGYQEGNYTSIDAYKSMIFYGRLNKKQPGERTLLPNLFSIPFSAPVCVQAYDHFLLAGGLLNFSIYEWDRQTRNPRMIYDQENTPTLDFLYRNNNLYLANDYKGLNVYEVSDLSHPELIGSVSTFDRPNRMCFIDNTAYIAAHQSHVVRFDISNPHLPLELESLEIPGLARVWSVAYHNELLFALGPKFNERNNLYILVMEPLRNEVLTEYELPYMETLSNIASFHFNENLCAVNLGTEGLEILDISDIFAIRSLSHIYKGESEFFDCEWHGDWLFTSDYRGSYHIYDISDPHLPVRISSIQTSTNGGNGIELIWPYLIASDGDSGIAIINVIKPEKPSLAYRLPSVWGTDIRVDDNYIYMADGNGQLKVFDHSDLPEIEMVAELPHSGYWTHVYLHEGHIYGLDIHHGIYIYRLEKASQQLARAIPNPEDVVLHKNYPNPFNAMTFINFELQHETPVNLCIYNIVGQKVETLIDNVLPAGEVKLHWDATEFPSGTYFYVLKTPDKEIKRRMELIK